MPDTAKQAPAKEQKPLTLSFFYASNGQAQLGEAILKKLGEAVLKQLGEEKSYAKVFPAETVEKIRAYHKGSKKKKNHTIPDDFIDQVVKPAMEDFLNVTCPSAKNKPQIAKWVFEQYLSHRQNGRPIKAKDLHKIGENIVYFAALKKTPLFKNSDPKPNSDVTTYKTYAAFEEMLAPFQQHKAENKKLHDDAFRVSAQKKAQVMAETTMLYNGPEGQVVVTHSPGAIKYWGINTKWCFSGSAFRIPKARRRILGLKIRLPRFNIRNGGINFPIYNKISPIIVLIPKGRQDDKVLMIEEGFYNSANKWMATLPESHQHLMQSCLVNLSESARKAMESWIPGNSSAPAGDPHTDPALLEKVIQELNNIKVLYKKPDAVLWSNRDFVRAAVRQDGAALKYAARKLRRDRVFVSSLLEECADLPFNIAKQTKRDFASGIMKQFNDLYFDKVSAKQKVASLRGRARVLRGKKIWQPEDAELTAYKMKALEQIAEMGDRKKFVQYSRRYPATWGDPETLFAADPVATVRIIEAELPAKRPLLSRLRP